MTGRAVGARRMESSGGEKMMRGVEREERLDGGDQVEEGVACGYAYGVTGAGESPKVQWVGPGWSGGGCGHA